MAYKIDRRPIIERLQYNLCAYWEQLYEIDELETIANSWGTSIY